MIPAATVAAYLRTRGLRLAEEGEPGWYVVLWIDGQRVSAFATDAPRRPQ